jgi:hypothetical protein
MSEGVALQGREASAASECRHHWIIESPQGATSWGVCKLCGVKKEFPNSASDSLWEGDPGTALGGAGASPFGRRGSAWVDRSSPGDDF